MSKHDVVVIGAGPAGVEAALTAHSCGLDVLVIDEAGNAGGQIYRAGPASNIREGEALRNRLNHSRIHIEYEHRVWTALKTNAGFEVAAAGPNGSVVIEGKAMIVASGAIERFYPKPGWTLPGVIGLGAATIMLKAQGVLPGARVLVAGPGPLAPLVAHLIQEHGGTVVAFVDPNPRSVWLKALPAMRSRIDLLLDGMKWIGQLMARRVPVLHGWDIASFQGHDAVDSVTLRSLANPNRTRSFNVDAACFGDGLFPSTEFYKLPGAQINYTPERGGWTPKIDEHHRTTVAGLYAAGDSAELLGVSAAPLTGRIAALAAALDIKKISESRFQTDYSQVKTALRPAVAFGRTVARMMQPRTAVMAGLPDETIVCRCEDVLLGELRLAIDQGAREMNALKAATRCGMGPCGGRICAEAAAAVMRCAGIPQSSIGYWSARPPLRPVPIEALTGTFDYSDIPISEPAPL